MAVQSHFLERENENAVYEVTAELCTRPALVSKWQPGDSAHSAPASHWMGGDNRGASRLENFPSKTGSKRRQSARSRALPRVPRGAGQHDDGVRCGWEGVGQLSLGWQLLG